MNNKGLYDITLENDIEEEAEEFKDEGKPDEGSEEEDEAFCYDKALYAND